MEVAAGYYIERAVSMIAYGFVFLCSVIQMYQWGKVTNWKLKRHHYISGLPLMIQSFISMIVHIDFRVVFGIFDYKGVTVMVMLISHTIMIGMTLHFLRFTKVRIPQGHEKARVSANAMKLKPVALFELSFIVASSISYGLVFATNRLCYFSIVWFGFSILGPWSFFVLKEKMLLIEQMAKSASSAQQRGVFAKTIPSIKLTMAFSIVFFFALFGLGILFAVQATEPYDILWKIDDPSKFQFSVIMLLTPLNVGSCGAFMFIWFFVGEGTIWNGMKKRMNDEDNNEGNPSSQNLQQSNKFNFSRKNTGKTGNSSAINPPSTNVGSGQYPASPRSGHISTTEDPVSTV
jgi:hypothetical protein